MPIPFRNDTGSDDKIEYQTSLFLKVKIKHSNVTKMLWVCPIFFPNKISLMFISLSNVLLFENCHILAEKAV